MIRLIMILSMALLVASTVEAQEPTEAIGTAGEATESGAAEAVAEPVAVDEASVGEVSLAYEDPSPPDEGDPDCLTKVYCKVVKGKMWIEGTFGPAKFNATKFRTINLLEDFGGNLSPKVVVKGPEYGAAIGAQFKIFSIGARFKYAKFEPFDLLTAGVDMGFLVKRVPFVHPYARLGLYYNTTRGGTVIPVLDQLLENTKTNGGGASLGVGVRVPVIKWLSVAIGFDYTFIGLYVKGFDPAEGEDFSNGTIGGEISGTFALTVHPI
ncbi:MAG: hypothetical protein KJO40_11725 [Deltaproteobacteria bacterium]|nr:hypothetical protein [Deltaproteobacteria bacterium]NND30844.1 hypothetical protein [Myxococcales bacterium]MBT8464716.1 hypothetical protein [Deltaproteobacteria bacterium]MBT8480907.1 hypothetical protein [Deltaproteobacteria bacterium]NNK06152.1 hypothetical protein [Myxococcales bacterium]